jgi:hypothetical protein
MKRVMMERTLWLAGVALLAGTEPVVARDFRVAQLGGAAVLGCAACHVSSGGGGPRNLFGVDVGAITGTSARAFWSPALAAKDSDGDGFTNGEEMGDPEGDGVFIPGALITNPGNPNSKPPPKALPLSKVAVLLTETGLDLSWDDGTGPFAVQRKQTLADAAFGTVEVTTNRSLAVAREGSTGFFRVADLVGVTNLALTARLSGEAERPNPVSTGASGLGSFQLKGDDLTVDVSYENLSGPAVAAHIHGPAPASASASVMIDLAPLNGGSFGISGALQGTIKLTASQRTAILAGQTYVNVHTAANPGGEIRGQILP